MAKILVRGSVVIIVAVFVTALAFGLQAGYAHFFQSVPGALAVPAARVPVPLSLREAESAIVDAAANVMPAVVAISTKETVRMPSYQSPFEDHPFFRHFFENEFGGMGSRERVRSGLGTGVIVDGKGTILTNFHVIKGADEIQVTLDDGRELAAEVLGQDEKTDIAILRITESGTYPSAPLGNSDELRVGMFTIAIGTPFSKSLSQTVTMGIISALGRSGLGIESEENLIQTDAAINQGNSGGPLVNLSGEVIGINTAIITGGGAGSDGVGFAIPINTARYVLSSIVTDGKVVRGYLGVTLQNIDDDLRRNLGLDSTHGALVTDVMDKSPASRARLQRGDVIISWNGKEIRNIEALTQAVGMTEVSKEVELVFMREGKRSSAKIKVDERPSDDQVLAMTGEGGDESTIEKLGVKVKFVMGEEATRYSLPRDGAVVVTAVEPGSRAQMLGIAPGTGILEVNGKAIASIADLTAALGRQRGLTMLLRTRYGNRYIAIN